MMRDVYSINTTTFHEGQKMLLYSKHFHFTSIFYFTSMSRLDRKDTLMLLYQWNARSTFANNSFAQMVSLLSKSDKNKYLQVHYKYIRLVRTRNYQVTIPHTLNFLSNPLSLFKPHVKKVVIHKQPHCPSHIIIECLF